MSRAVIIVAAAVFVRLIAIAIAAVVAVVWNIRMSSHIFKQTIIYFILSARNLDSQASYSVSWAFFSFLRRRDELS